MDDPLEEINSNHSINKLFQLKSYNNIMSINNSYIENQTIGLFYTKTNVNVKSSLVSHIDT